MTYDLSREPYDGRVVKVNVRCTTCHIPRFVPIEDERVYRIVVNSFVGGGGDGYDVIEEQGQNYMEGNYLSN